MRQRRLRIWAVVEIVVVPLGVFRFHRYVDSAFLPLAINAAIIAFGILALALIQEWGLAYQERHAASPRR